MPTVKEMKRPFIVFGKPDIGEDEIEAVSKVLRSGWIGTGPVCQQLEETFKAYMGSDKGFAIAASSCSIGLVAALKAIHIFPRDLVLTTPLTFAATANAIVQAGGIPKFVDVGQDGNIDPNLLDETALKGIKAIMPVDYTGNPLKMHEIANLGLSEGVPVIEDCAHGFGGSYLGFPMGHFADISVFSFYATKNVTAGEGGMIFTRSSDLARRIKAILQNGQSKEAWKRYSAGPLDRYEVVEPGVKGNLPDILAAIALTQINRWPELHAKRSKVWRIYESFFGKKPAGHSQHLFTIQALNRDKLRALLHEAGVGTGIHYTPLHLEPAFEFLGHKAGDFPMAEHIGRTTLSLPVSNSMTEDDAFYVVDTVKKIVEKNKDVRILEVK